MAKRMPIKRAIKIACEAIDSEIQKLAVNANLYERYHMPSGVHAWEKREKLRAARLVLADLAERGPAQMGLFDS